MPHAACARHRGYPALSACRQQTLPCGSSSPTLWSRTRSAPAPCPWRCSRPRARAARRACACPSASARSSRSARATSTSIRCRSAVVRHSAPSWRWMFLHHAAGIALQPPQGLAHPLELAGMGIAPDLARQPRREPRVALAQRQARFLRERHQTLPTGLLVKPRIRGMGDCLLHHRGVHDHRLDAAFRDHPGPAARLDRLGQQPLDALLADPLTPPRQRRGVEREAVLERTSRRRSAGSTGSPPSGRPRRRPTAG